MISTWLLMNFNAVLVLLLLVGVGAYESLFRPGARGLVLRSQSYYPLLRNTRVVGGVDVNEGEHPWQVSIQSCRQKDCPGDKVGKHFCGGTLIGPRWVLTAAHCALAVLNLRSDRVQVVFGTTLIDRLVHPPARIEKVILSNYNKLTKENDIALLKLKERVRFASNRQPLGLYPGIPANDLCDIQGSHIGHCVVTGYGRVSEGGKSSPKLKAATILFVNTKQCQKQIPQKVIQRSMLCAGAEGRDACQGDSGGPLVCKLRNDPENKFFLMGVTSWGIGCATPHTPGVYSEVACYMDWIKNVTSTA